MQLRIVLKPGTVPPGGRPSFRHLFAYIVFERFLKYHTFTVIFDPTVVVSGVVPFPRFNEDLLSIINPGKSAYTFMIVEPSVELLDTLNFYSEQLSLNVGVHDTVILQGLPNQLTVGDPWKPWEIGDFYHYGPGTVVMDHGYVGVPFAGGVTPLIVGGADPQDFCAQVTSGIDGVFSNIPGAGLLEVTLLGTTPAFYDADVGKYVHQVSQSAWYLITNVVSTTLSGPTRVVSTAYLSTSVVPEAVAIWGIYETPTSTQMSDWAVQIKVV